MPNDNPVQPITSVPTPDPIPTSPFSATSSDVPTPVPTPDLGGGGIPPTVSVDDKPKKYFVSPKGRKFVATLFGLLILVGGLTTGGYLVQQQQLLQQKASTGRPEVCDPIQSDSECIEIGIGGECGTGKTCQVSAGSTVCSCLTGETTTTISCQNIRIYDFNWTLLSAADLKLLKPGDRVYLTVTGEPTTENFDKAHFSINDGAWIEVGRDHIHTGTTTEFFYLYTIPSNNSAFKVKAEVYSVTLNTWI